MNIRLAVLSLTSTFFLAACGDHSHSSYHYDDGYYDYYEFHDDDLYPVSPPQRETEPAPITLQNFHVIDSFGLNSELGDVPLVISPWIDDGHFEVFWDVDSYSDYRVELSISDTPSPFDGHLISSSVCGGLRDCGNSHLQFCHYGVDLSLECELPESMATTGKVDISYLFDTIPEHLFLILEVCGNDDFYCEYQSRGVIFE